MMTQQNFVTKVVNMHLSRKASLEQSKKRNKSIKKHRQSGGDKVYFIYTAPQVTTQQQVLIKPTTVSSSIQTTQRLATTSVQTTTQPSMSFSLPNVVGKPNETVTFALPTRPMQEEKATQIDQDASTRNLKKLTDNFAIVTQLQSTLQELQKQVDDKVASIKKQVQIQE